MKILSIALITLTILTGCATKPTDPNSFSASEQELRSNLTFVNYKIWGDFPKDDYTDFSEVFYLNKLATYSAKPAKQLTEHLKDFEIREFKTSKDSFVICGFSKKIGIAFCDDAQCNGVENFEHATSPAILAVWKESLPLKTCNRDLR